MEFANVEKRYNHVKNLRDTSIHKPYCKIKK